MSTFLTCWLSFPFDMKLVAIVIVVLEKKYWKVSHMGVFVNTN